MDMTRKQLEQLDRHEALSVVWLALERGFAREGARRMPAQVLIAEANASSLSGRT